MVCILIRANAAGSGFTQNVWRKLKKNKKHLLKSGCQELLLKVFSKILKYFEIF